ncbi:hypothetical protein ABIF96_005764 [Bradyrhizobium ottawaense]|uniref:GcrA family cell cycle regulator n=1 Tax=Bradyrhizobium ottawaense TaxID=931866 RepID=UPI00383983BE
MSWTEEKVETLKRLHGEGVSFTLICEAVGMTRNSCIGKARRLELPMRVTVKAKNGEPRPKGQRRPYLRVVRANGDTDKLRVIETVQTDLPTFRCDVVPLNKTLDEVGVGSCRYITGDPLADGPGLYCGHPAVKRSYCEAHFARCYIEPQKRWGAPAKAISRTNLDSIHGKMVSVDSGNLSDADQTAADLALASEPEPA